MISNPFPMTGPLRMKKRETPRQYHPELRNPRQMGASSARTGGPRSENPFPCGTGQSRRWDAGYLAAIAKAESR